MPRARLYITLTTHFVSPACWRQRPRARDGQVRDFRFEAPTAGIDEPPAKDRSDRARGRSGRRPYAGRAAFRFSGETLAQDRETIRH
jgi:hypothetical protein